MKQNLHICVSKQRMEQSAVSCRNITIRERLLNFLFGRKHQITILVPGDAIEELEITKSKKGEPVCAKQM